MSLAIGSEDMDVAILPHINRLYINSECRTPLICCLQDGDPQKSIEALARKKGCAVWNITMDSPKNEQNALDYLEVGLQNGDWVYLTKNETASSKTLREIALQLLTVVPDPRNFPKRELFRLWLAVESDINLNETNSPIFPTLLTQNALYARKKVGPGKEISTKLVSKRSVEPSLFKEEHERRQRRVECGRESDSESDADDPAQRKTGLWFHRSVDFYEADTNNTVTQQADDIFDAIEQDEVEKVKAIVQSHSTDINKVTRSGMTPLLWAVMCDNLAMVRHLLEAGADPNQRRLGSGIPPIFMSLEQVEMLQLLVDYGADLEAKFEGYPLVDHPDTAPNIKAYLKTQMS